MKRKDGEKKSLWDIRFGSRLGQMSSYYRAAINPPDNRLMEEERIDDKGY